VLGIRNDSGQVNVRRNGSLDFSDAAIPEGQITILTLVVQPDGTFKVWTNGVEIMNVTSTSDMTSLVPGVTGGGRDGFGTYINVGRNNPDGWTTFNGNIGDVFVYKVALTEPERQQIESIVMSRFAPAANLTAKIELDPFTGDPIITFNTVPGLRYKVEYVEALPVVPTTWSEVFPGIRTADSNTMSVPDEGAALVSQQRFYRVVQVP